MNIDLWDDIRAGLCLHIWDSDILLIRCKECNFTCINGLICMPREFAQKGKVGKRIPLHFQWFFIRYSYGFCSFMAMAMIFYDSKLEQPESERHSSVNFSICTIFTLPKMLLFAVRCNCVFDSSSWSDVTWISSQTYTHCWRKQRTYKWRRKKARS